MPLIWQKKACNGQKEHKHQAYHVERELSYGYDDHEEMKCHIFVSIETDG